MYTLATAFGSILHVDPQNHGILSMLPSHGVHDAHGSHICCARNHGPLLEDPRLCSRGLQSTVLHVFEVTHVFTGAAKQPVTQPSSCH